MTLVSIIIPCFNEEGTIRIVLEAICKQTYPLRDVEVIIADGLSTDSTRAVITAFQMEHPYLNICLIDNPKRIIPAALNVAILAAHGCVIVRLDAHSVPAPEYVERCVHALEAGFGANVGGIWKIQPGGPGWLAQSIAVAASHPLAVGDVAYRLGGKPHTVDTVPFGAFYKELALQMGLFDETLHTNEDYEFNVRIRQAGGKVWFDPAIQSTYFARNDLRALASQYWRYGYWKAQMLMRYPQTIRWRQALPPIFVLSLIGLVVISIIWKPALILLLSEIIIYFVSLLISGLQLMLEYHKPILWVGVPLAIATMHFAWGTAFLYGLLRPVKLPQ